MEQLRQVPDSPRDFFLRLHFWYSEYCKNSSRLKDLQADESGKNPIHFILNLLPGPAPGGMDASQKGGRCTCI